jgi:FkbM family methyltransferase
MTTSKILNTGMYKNIYIYKFISSLKRVFSLFVHYAKVRYIIYRVFLRLKLGKQKRNKYLKEKMIVITDFLPERTYSINGFKVILRKGSNDFSMFCLPREEEIVNYLKINDNETFVDVGANVGAYSLKIASDYKSKGIKVIAIEAHPANYKALCKNIDINKFTNIHAINKAVSDHKGIVTMYERKNLKRIIPEWYTIHETFSPGVDLAVVNEEGNTLPQNQKGSGHQLDKRYSIEVESDTLDAILDNYKVDFIKIDIEGAEVEALKGATNTLDRLRKIIVEIHENNFDKVKHILEDHNFEIEIITNKIKKSEGFVVGTKKMQASSQP